MLTRTMSPPVSLPSDASLAGHDLAAGDLCPDHGRPTKRAACKSCNAAYMRRYLRARRRTRPEVELLRRARDRAHRAGFAFDLRQPPEMPKYCPVFGIVLTPGGHRRSTSPSLDRINPDRGYVTGNVRVISDKANRLKGNRSLEELRALSVVGASAHRAEFALVARYVEREALLAEVRKRAGDEGAAGEWARLADFLDRAFAMIGARHV